MRGAFYYPWYPEKWTEAGHRYTPLLGLYDSGDRAVMRSHLQQMKWAKVDVAIYSWWGPNTPTDLRLPAFLEEAAAAGIKVAILYEHDWDGRASYLFRVRPDLRHIGRYLDHRAYATRARADGSTAPVVFVYNPLSSARNAQKWGKARSEFGLYVALSDYPDWWTGARADAWYGYRPSMRGYLVALGDRRYAVSISAGFWSTAEATPRLDRNFTAWEGAVDLMRQSGADWQLVYWNEHGEGTAIEPSDARCEAYLCSDYLTALAKG